MAKVSSVRFKILPVENDPSSMMLSVNKLALKFDKDDVGILHHLSITIYGKDTPQDNLPSDDDITDDELYIFRFWHNQSSGFGVPYQKIIPETAITMIIKDPIEAKVNTSDLNEDSGLKAKVQNGYVLYYPRKDEIYASVTLSRPPSPPPPPPSTKESEVVTLMLF